MEHRIYGEVADDLAHARSLPRESYLDPAAFEAERRDIFEREWFSVARANAISAAGDYVCVDLFGVPLIIVRDGQGEVHALSRVCRHRAMPVAEGSGNVKAFLCPYHLWRYGLDGALLSAPAMEQSAVFSQKDCALPRYRVEIWQGWVFVSLDPAAKPLAPRLAGLERHLDGIDLSNHKTAAVLEFDSPWNWKIMVENFMESYHHIGPHAETLQPTNPAFGTYVTEEGDAADYAVLENPPSDGHQHLTVFAAFPAHLFAVQRGEGDAAFWYQMEIEAPDFFRLKVHVLLPDDLAAEPEIVELVSETLRAIHMEDIEACEGVQAGLKSPAMKPGPLSHLERALWQFYRYLARTVREGG